MNKKIIAIIIASSLVTQSYGLVMPLKKLNYFTFFTAYKKNIFEIISKPKVQQAIRTSLSTITFVTTIAILIAILRKKETARPIEDSHLTKTLSQYVQTDEKIEDTLNTADKKTKEIEIEDFNEEAGELNLEPIQFFDEDKSIEDQLLEELYKTTFPPEKPNGKTEDLVALRTEKLKILALKIRNPEEFGQLDVKIPNIILLYGQAKTKQSMVRNIAAKLDTYIFTIPGDRLQILLDNKANETFKNILTNAIILKNQIQKPIILLIDEIDLSLQSNNNDNDQTINELFLQLHQSLLPFEEDAKNIYIFATTTHNSEHIHKSVNKKGPFGKIKIPLPKKKERRKIIEECIQKTPFITKSLKTDDFYDNIAEETKGRSIPTIKKTFECDVVDDLIHTNNKIVLEKRTKRTKTKTAKQRELVKFIKEGINKKFIKKGAGPSTLYKQKHID